MATREQLFAMLALSVMLRNGDARTGHPGD